MTIVEYFHRKAEILSEYQNRNYDYWEARAYLRKLNDEAVAEGLPVGTATEENIRETLYIIEREEDETSYEESYEASYEESYDDSYC